MSSLYSEQRRNGIFFREREGEEEELKVNRIPRPTQAPDHPLIPQLTLPFFQALGSLPPDEMDNKDQVIADKSQGSSHSHWPIPQPEAPSPLQSKNGRKRKIAVPDSDSNPGSSDPEGYETDPKTRLPPRKKQRRYSTAIEYAAAAGLKEAGAEFARIVSMGAEEGTHYLKENYDHIKSTGVSQQRLTKQT
ncbi:hypothetical protein BDM02DRAFT_3132783 [Thelephora ganbajun]|uniref:Uncharacterized protein n=1 Tax=Thelephora ganbajun TaxID=370292 RepID=A0ACB6Z0W8_THEGA|nr:hypothetical protein BDM02DRAFT_3132783 [Thelephora ganbajun]